MHSRVEQRTLGAVLCAITWASLAGCGQDVDNSTAAAVRAETRLEQAELHEQRLAAVAAETRGMTQGDPIVGKTIAGKTMAGRSSAGKPGAPVDLKYELKGEPAMGEALPVDIALLPHAPAGLLRVTFIATDGLAIEPGQLPAEFLATQADEVYRHTLTITPRDDGEYYLSAIVLMNLENGPEARTFTIPIRVGAAAVRETAALKSEALPVDATGQPLEIMKAEPQTPPR